MNLPPSNILKEASEILANLPDEEKLPVLEYIDGLVKLNSLKDNEPE